MRQFVAWILLSSAALAAGPTPPRSPAYPVPADFPDGWYAHIDTNMGRILVLLLDKQSPQAVAHFAALANGEMPWNDPISGEQIQQPYYDGAVVTRAKGGLLLEAGDKSGAGGYAPAIFVPMEGVAPINFDVGYRMGLKRLSGGQVSATRFFITASAQSFMTGDHSCIGVVLQGQARVFQITSVKTRPSGDPIEDVVFNKIRVFKVGDPDPLPEPVPYFPGPWKRGIELKDKGPLKLRDDKETKAREIPSS